MQQVTDASFQYDVNQFLNNLPAYDQSFMTDEMLDLVRNINESGNYYWLGAAFPNIPQGSATNVIAYTTVSGSVQVPPGSYVTSFTHHCNQTAGFKVKIYDKGTKASIFYGDWGFDRAISSNMSIPADGTPFGPNYLMNPFIVTPPGVINWEITNMSSSDALIQMLLAIAVPVNNMSIGNKEINKVEV